MPPAAASSCFRSPPPLIPFSNSVKYLSKTLLIFSNHKCRTLIACPCAAGAARSPAQAQRWRHDSDHRVWQQVAAALHFSLVNHRRLFRVAVPKHAASGGGALDDSVGGGLAAPPTRGTPFPLDLVRNQQVRQCISLAEALLFFVLVCSQNAQYFAVAW